MSNHQIRKKCAICENKNLSKFLSYLQVPLAGYFPTIDEINNEEKFDLNILFCDKCFLVQSDSVIDADSLFKDYRYMSSIGLSKHFEGVSKLLKNYFNLNYNSKIIEIGSNDGVLQQPFKEKNINVLGFEPAVNISKVATNKKLQVINDYFNYENTLKYLPNQKNTYDLIISNNCFAHIDNIKSVIKGVNSLLKNNGHFVIEVHYVKDLIDSFQYESIYHEHLYYYSLTSLKNLFDEFDMTIVDFDHIPIHGGSIRVYVKNKQQKLNTKVSDKLKYESDIGMNTINYYKDFANNVQSHINKTVYELIKIKQSGNKIAGYGASGRANMFCNICKMANIIDFIVDESPERCGRYIAGQKIPIVSVDDLKKSNVKYVLILAWNYAKMIMNKLSDKDYKYILAFPEFKIINSDDDLSDLNII